MALLRPRLRVLLTGVLQGLKGLLVRVGHVPVEDAAHEGGDECHPRLGAGHGLGEGEEQRHVAVDAMLLLQLPVGGGRAA